MINKVTLIGNLGRDPEVRTTGAGMAIGNLRLATTERVKDREGNWTDHTEWHTVVCFGRTAENVAKYLTKGRQVYIEGKLRTREWQDKEGAKRISTEIVADDVRFIGGREGGAGGVVSAVVNVEAYVVVFAVTREHFQHRPQLLGPPTRPLPARHSSSAAVMGSSSNGARPMNSPLYQRTLLQVTDPST